MKRTLLLLGLAACHPTPASPERLASLPNGCEVWSVPTDGCGSTTAMTSCPPGVTATMQQKPETVVAPVPVYVHGGR